jgi:hypothetical protein
MIADYMTKPLTGAKFHTFRKAIMGKWHSVGRQECVGREIMEIESTESSGQSIREIELEATCILEEIR